MSPTLAGQLENLLKDLPEAKWHVWEPLHRDAAWHGAQLAFGEPVNAVCDFTKADVVLSLDADFLQCGAGNLAYAADFMSRRRVRTSEKDAGGAEMNRLYMVETALSCTGAKADHRLALRSVEIEAIARAAAGKLGISSAGQAGAPGTAGTVVTPGRSRHEQWIAAVAKDLQAHRGRSLVLAGDRQPAAVHLLAHVMNDRLANVGQTVTYTAPIDARPGDRTQSLRDLVHDMETNRVEMLVILGANPVYSAPADLDFAKRLESVPLRIHHSLFHDETSYLCHWHLPEAHYLESWSDSRAHDGTASLVQPLIAPLYEGRSAHEVVALLATLQETPGKQIVREHWKKRLGAGVKEGGFERSWRTALHNGVVAGTAFKPKSVKVKAGWEDALREGRGQRAEVGGQTSSISDLRPLDWSSCSFPIRRSTTDNGQITVGRKSCLSRFRNWRGATRRMMSPATARQIGVGEGSYAHGGEHGGYYMPVVELQCGDRSVSAPVWVVPGHADGAISVFLGNGRERAGRVGGSQEQQVGFNAYRLRTADGPWHAAGLVVRKTSRTELVCLHAGAPVDGKPGPGPRCDA